MDCFKKKTLSKIYPKKSLSCLICAENKKIQEFRCDNCKTENNEKSWYICYNCNLSITEKGMNCPICRGKENKDKVIVNHYTKYEKCIIGFEKKIKAIKYKYRKIKSTNDEQSINDQLNDDKCYLNLYCFQGFVKICLILFSLSLMFHTICMKNMINNCYICNINTTILSLCFICMVFVFFKKINECFILLLSIIISICIVTVFATIGSCKIDYYSYITLMFLIPIIFKINLSINRI